jgi:hypothetical protein
MPSGGLTWVIVSSGHQHNFQVNSPPTSLSSTIILATVLSLLLVLVNGQQVGQVELLIYSSNGKMK